MDRHYLANNETNGLTLAAVGSKTVLSYIQVSMGGDDSFEWFGGTVNASYLVANRGLDDDFDTDWGYQGRVQFAVSVRNPEVADISGSNGFESDNDATGTTNDPKTNPTFSNISSYGPIQQIGETVNTNYKRGAHIRRNSEMDLRNSVVSGWPNFTKIEGSNADSYIANGTLRLANNIYAGCPSDIETGSVPEANVTWLSTNNNTSLTNPTDVQYVNPYATSNPNFNPQTTSPVLSGADFTGMSGFVTTTNVGAFSLGTDYGRGDWTDCWTNFDPQNDPYTDQQNYSYTATVSSSSVVVGTPVSVNASGSTGYYYAWYETAAPNTIIGTDSSFTPTATGAYRVLVADQRGCYNLLEVTATLSTAVAEEPVMESKSNRLINLSPNPNNGSFTIDFFLASASDNITLAITDMLGRTIFTQTTAGFEGNNRIDLDTNLSNGIYMILIEEGTNHFAKRFIINK